MSIGGHQLARPLVSGRLTKDESLCVYREQFQTRGIVKIDRFFEPIVFDDLKQEVEQLLRFAKRRNFTMRAYETPRRMAVVGGRTICRYSEKLALLYYSQPIIEFLSAVVGSRLLLSQQQDAFMTINHLEGDGDTQGWHLDDGSTAVIYAFSTPDEGEGGALEYIPGWPDYMTAIDTPEGLSVQSVVDVARKQGLVRSLHLTANTMYILKSDTSLHRVTPLINPKRSRTVVAAGYESQRVRVYSHTGSDLYTGA